MCSGGVYFNSAGDVMVCLYVTGKEKYEGIAGNLYLQISSAFFAGGGGGVTEPGLPGYCQEEILPESPDNPFVGDARDEVRNIDTPVGCVPVLVLGNRKDFERFSQAIGYRCEPRAIMPSVGDNTFFGVNNWRKILSHKEEYEKDGGRFWKLEFHEFTKNRENYQDIVCIVSQGSGLAKMRLRYWKGLKGKE